jgi:hypothetical protein
MEGPLGVLAAGPSSGSMTFADLIERYFANPETSAALSAKTLHHYRGYLNFYIAPYLGGRSVR